MKHYRLYKIENGKIVKGKDIEELDDQAALKHAEHDGDCPDCEVWHGQRKVAVVK